MSGDLGSLSRATAQDWRTANGVTKGTIHEVDAKAGLARLRLGGTDDKPFLGPWVPYHQTMGALKLHNPPSVGQQMFMLSTGGDYAQGVLIPLSQSNDNPSPSEKDDEHVLTFGPYTITLKGQELSVKGPKILFDCAGATFELTGGGLKMSAPAYEFD